MPYCKKGQLTLEKTANYFRIPSAPLNVFKMNPNVKLIVILRDPVSRTVSQYTHCLDRGEISIDSNMFKSLLSIIFRVGLVSNKT